MSLTKHKYMYFYLAILCSLFIPTKHLNALETRYGIYATPSTSSSDPKNEIWGGPHITLVGFHRSHGEPNKIQAVQQIAAGKKNSKKTWHPNSWSVQKWRSGWRIVIYSDFLDDLAEKFKKSGFFDIKGKKYAHVDFHITLPNVKTQKEAEKYAKSLTKKTWELTLVKRDYLTKEQFKCTWINQYPLKK